MKATVSKTDLDALVATTGAVRVRSSYAPVAFGTRLAVAGDRITACATDFDRWVTVGADCTGSADGVAIPNSRQLAAAVAGIAGPSVDLVVEDGMLTISDQHSTATLALLPADEWPRTPDVESAETVDATGWWPLVGRIASHASHDATRPILCSVRFDTGAIVATDSYRLAWANIDHGLDMLVSAETIQAVAKAAKGATAVRVATDGRTVSITAEGDRAVTLTSRLVEGDFPRWRGLLRSDSTYTVEVQTESLRSALTAAASFGADHEGVVLAEVDGRVMVKATGDEMSSWCRHLDDRWPADFQVKLNPAYLLDLLDAVDADTTSLAMIDGLKAVIGTDPSGDSPVTCLIMPVKL